MGLGKTLKIMLTQQVKCDNCGAVIVDGTYSTPRYNDWGQKLASYGGDGVGVLNTLVYGAKGKTLCRMCQGLEKHSKQMEKIMAKESEVLAEQRELEKENLKLENEYLKRKINNEAAKFCLGCGNALKQNARFCAKCGQRIG